MERAKILLKQFWYRLSYLLARFSSDRCTDNAAALTYMTLFALVPLLTVAYTMASAVPAFQGLEPKIESFLFDNLMPETGLEMQQYLSDFSRQAKNLTGFGIAFLVATAILMLRNIEHAFNRIWRTRGNRSPVSSFLLYWAVLSLAPLTIGVALGINAYLSSFGMIFQDVEAAIGLKLAPLALYTLGFSMLYVSVPNCRVPFRHAVVGGMVAALAFNLARFLFTRLVVGSSYTFIYGAFAAVPLFLLWIYLSWIIVLVGGILVHSLSAYQSRERAELPTVLKGLDVLYLFWTRQREGHAIREIELLNNRHDIVKGLSSETWSELRDLFLKKRLISENARGQYLLSRDLHSITFWQLKEWIDGEQPVEHQRASHGLPWQTRAYEMLRDQRNQQRETLNISLSELFEE